MMANESRVSVIAIVVLVLVVGVVGYYVLNAPDRRDSGQKISDAIDALPKGIDKASDQLKSRTPGEKLNDAAKDAGSDIKKSLNQ